MDGVTDSTGWLNPEGPDPQMEGPPSESFQSMQALLETWLAGARLTDIASGNAGRGRVGQSRHHPDLVNLTD